MLQGPQNEAAQEDLIRSLSKEVAELELSIAQKPPGGDEAKAIAGAIESLRINEISEQALVDQVIMDENSFSASSYIAAITLAKWSRRRDVVLPYFGRMVDWFFETGLPQDSHAMMREIFEAVTLYGRVRSLEFNENAGEMTSLQFHKREEEGDDNRLTWDPDAPRPSF